MSLDERKMRILQAIIDDYILTAIPVGSRTISKNTDIGLSPATIRNEMADLEELGYLEQPHTSAGRIPSHKAFRLYANHLLNSVKLGDTERRFIKKRFDSTITGIESIVKQTADVLSDLTKYTSIVLPPQMRDVKLKHLQIVPLSDTTAIAVIVLDTGMTRNARIHLPSDFDREMLDKLSRKLTDALYDARLASINTESLLPILDEFGYQKALAGELVDSMKKNALDEKRLVQLSGVTNILNYPEYSDIGKAKRFFTTIEATDYLYELMREATKLEFSINIGSDNDSPDMKDCSIVTATYRVGDMPIGSMGVIGPMRMNYARVLAILKFMGESLSEIMTNIFEEDGRKGE